MIVMAIRSLSPSARYRHPLDKIIAWNKAMGRVVCCFEFICAAVVCEQTSIL